MSDPTDEHILDTADQKRFARTRRLLAAIIGLLGALTQPKEHWRGTVESLIDYAIEQVDYYTPLSVIGEFEEGIYNACNAFRTCPLRTILWAALSTPITFSPPAS
jgi:hypothetical protein